MADMGNELMDHRSVKQKSGTFPQTQSAAGSFAAKPRGIAAACRAAGFTAVFMVLCVMLAACGGERGHRGPGGGPRGAAGAGEEIYPLTAADMQTEASADAAHIDLSSCMEPLRIKAGGEYILSGSISHCIFIEAQDQLVHLYLDGCSIRSGSGPGLNVMSADKVVITLLPGTENTIRDSQNYHNYDLYEAAVSAPCDLTINGEGSLFVYGFYKDAIRSSDILKLHGGTYFVQAKRDGLRGTDGLVLSPDSLTVETERNGLVTAKEQKRGKGIMDVRGGEIRVTSGKYAVSCSSDLYLRTDEFMCISVYGDYSVAGRTFDLRERREEAS